MFASYALWQITHGFMVGSGGPDNKSYFSILQSNKTVFIVFTTIAFSFIPLIIYRIRTVFSSKCPKIVIKDTTQIQLTIRLCLHQRLVSWSTRKRQDLMKVKCYRKYVSRLYFNPIRSSFFFQKSN